MLKVTKMLKTHQPLVLNWFRTGRFHSSGTVEGMNSKARLALRKAYRFRSHKAFELVFFHTLGNLPEPEITHRFC